MSTDETSSSDEANYLSDESLEVLSQPDDKRDNNETPLLDAKKTFPQILHMLLDDAEQKGYTDIVSWQPHGRCFRVHKAREFVINCMPNLFRQTKWSSFQRQLNLYGFNRVSSGPDKGSYFHDLFLRGQPSLSDSMVRTRVKGTRVRVPGNKERTPNFYEMPPLDDPMLSADDSSIGTLMESDASHMGVSLEDSICSQVCSHLEESVEHGKDELEVVMSSPLRSPSPVRKDKENTPSRDNDDKTRKPNSKDGQRREVLLGLDELSLKDIFDYTPVLTDPRPPASTVEEVHVISDDPKKLQEMFALLGKPFSLDDLDNLPQDDDGWGCLLETDSGGKSHRRRPKRVSIV